MDSWADQACDMPFSDDMADYKMALAPTNDDVVRSRSETGLLAPPSPIRKSHRRCQTGPPTSALVQTKGSHRRSRSTPINEWDLTNSSPTIVGEEHSVSIPGFTSNLRTRPRLSLHRENLIDSLAWFSFHTPKCVLEDLTSNELENCEEILKVGGDIPPKIRKSPKPMDTHDDDDDDDDSLSSLSDDETKSASSISSKKRKHKSDGKRTTDILLSRQMPQNTLKMPYSTKQECALVFVDISGFTKLSTILDEETLSKVSHCLLLRGC